jgi:hypothetical protein
MLFYRMDDKNSSTGEGKLTILLSFNVATFGTLIAFPFAARIATILMRRATRSLLYRIGEKRASFLFFAFHKGTFYVCLLYLEPMQPDG